MSPPQRPKAQKPYTIARELLRLESEVVALRAEIRRWQSAYQTLAKAQATRPAPDPPPIPPLHTVQATTMAEPISVSVPWVDPVPPDVMGVVLETTTEGTPAQARALAFARQEISSGRKPADVALSLRLGEDIDI